MRIRVLHQGHAYHHRHEGAIPFDPAVSAQIDWEAELGVNHRRSGKNIPIEEAYITSSLHLHHDVSARDLQANHSQFFKGKSLDGACRWTVDRHGDEIPDPHHRSHVPGQWRGQQNALAPPMRSHDSRHYPILSPA